MLATANNASKAIFKIINAKRYVPVVTLSIEDTAKLRKQINEGLKRFVYWNKYKVIDNRVVNTAKANQEENIRDLLDSSYQGVRRLFVLAYDNTAGNDQVSVDSFKKYFLPRVKIENCNIEIDERNFYDQPINDSIKQYDELRKYQQHKVMIILQAVY